MRDQARKTVIARAKVNASLRRTFDSLGFIEVETPMLQVMHGGASARPFVTHSNAFDTELYLRIAPELYLKRAVVGGIDRVFEINRNFRNEGADSTHSPEFAMLEAYQAYGDYNTIADLTQQLIQNAALAVVGLARRHLGRRHRVRPRRRVGAHLDVRLALRGGRRARSRRRRPSSDLEALADARAASRSTHPLPGKYVEELWEHFVKGGLVRPDLRHGLPARHLARSCASTARSRASSRSGTSTSAASSSRPATPSSSTRSSSASASSSRRSSPPAATPRPCASTRSSCARSSTACRRSGGMGMGIDRLLMALTGLGIRETILFPLVK